MTMDARLTSLGDIPLIVPKGDIDHSNCQDVERLFDDAFSGGGDKVLVDLSQVSYIDSGGLSVLFTASRHLRDKGWLGLIAPNTSVCRLLEIVGVLADPGFRIFADRAAATAALSRTSS
jgi:anti-sigma B factor antagonist